MRNIAKAQYGMSRKLRKQYTSSTRCINPGDPGCGRGPKVKSNRTVRREQDELSKRVDERLAQKRALEKKPSIVKREYYEGMDVGPGANSQFRRPKKILKASPSSREVSAKKGTKLKAVKRVTKAQGGAKTPKDSSLIKRYSGPPFIKPKKPKAQYGVAKKSSKK
jgi:hypothetical protein